MDTLGLFKNRFRDNFDKNYQMQYEKSKTDNGFSCLVDIDQTKALQMSHISFSRPLPKFDEKMFF